MGLYTELIFGATLKKETPEEVLDKLRFMVGDPEIRQKSEYLIGRNPLTGGSFSFAVNRSVSEMWFSDIDNKWHISTRANIKNYDDEIEGFLEWVKPWIYEGSGARDIYAIVIQEEQEVPTMYFLD